MGCIYPAARADEDEGDASWLAAVPDSSALLLCAWRSFLGETGEPEASLAFAFYKEGASDPTFLFFKYALVEEKC